MQPTGQNRPVGFFNHVIRWGRKMGRWPDDKRLTLVTVVLVFLLFPVLCWLTWWFVRG
jgi:hypothetical protein